MNKVAHYGVQRTGTNLLRHCVARSITHLKAPLGTGWKHGHVVDVQGWTVFVAIRHPLDWLCSFYQYSKIKGEKRTFENFIKQPIKVAEWPSQMTICPIDHYMVMWYQYYITNCTNGPYFFKYEDLVLKQREQRYIMTQLACVQPGPHIDTPDVAKKVDPFNEGKVIDKVAWVEDQLYLQKYSALELSAATQRFKMHRYGFLLDQFGYKL